LAGGRAWFRTMWGNPWRFKSSLRHKRRSEGQALSAPALAASAAEASDRENSSRLLFNK